MVRLDRNGIMSFIRNCLNLYLWIVWKLQTYTHTHTHTHTDTRTCIHTHIHACMDMTWTLNAFLVKVFICFLCLVVGKYKTQVVNACRDAVKTNSVGLLFKIMTTGSAWSLAQQDQFDLVSQLGQLDIILATASDWPSITTGSAWTSIATESAWPNPSWRSVRPTLSRPTWPTLWPILLTKLILDLYFSHIATFCLDIVSVLTAPQTSSFSLSDWISWRQSNNRVSIVTCCSRNCCLKTLI